MKRSILLVPAVALLLLAAPMFAQTPTPTVSPFAISAGPCTIAQKGSTLPATCLVGTLDISPNFKLRDDNILAPGADAQIYMGGVNYDVSHFFQKVEKSRFQIYVSASVGVSRIVPAVGPTKQGIGALFGSGINYDPTNTGHFSINLGELRCGNLPGVSGRCTFGSSIKWTF